MTNQGLWKTVFYYIVPGKIRGLSWRWRIHLYIFTWYLQANIISTKMSQRATRTMSIGMIYWHTEVTDNRRNSYAHNAWSILSMMAPGVFKCQYIVWICTSTYIKWDDIVHFTLSLLCISFMHWKYKISRNV